MIPRVGTDRPMLAVVTDVMLSSPADPYLSVKAAASYTSLSPRLIRGWLSDLRRPLAHYRVGGRVLIRRSDLDAYLAAFRQERAGMAGRVAAVVDEVVGAVRATRKA